MKIILPIFAMFFGVSFAMAQCPSYGSSSTTTSIPAVSNISTSSAVFTNSSVVNFSNSNSYQTTSALSYQEIQGSPFLNSEPLNGTVVFNDDSVINDVPINIDMYANEIIATKPNGEKIALDGRFYKEIILSHEGEELVFKKANEDEPSKFYQVLYDDGDMVFFKDNYVTLREGSNNGFSKTPSKFTPRTNYFIKHGDDQIVKVKLKKKDIFPLIPDSELYAMQEYARKKGLKLNSELNFIAFFEGGRQ